MALPHLRPALASAIAVLALTAAACGGDSNNVDPTADPATGTTPIPTASPLPTVPVPTILDSDSNTSPDGGTQEVLYVVVAGDTLSRIAEEFGTTVDALSEANALDGSSIFVGQELTIPGTSGGTGAGTPSDSGGAAATATTPPTAGADTYTVQAGDSGFGIALQFDTTLEELAAVNGLSVDDLSDLQIGQVLQIPRS